MRRLAITTLVLAGLGAPALADDTTGTIAAYDRLANIIVLKDMTIWEVPGSMELPADLAAGDRVKIVFTSAGDSGVGTIRSITRVEE